MERDHARMHFLAHSLLAGDDPAAIAGQFCADFVRGRAAIEHYPDALRRGVLLHRQIDAFTDAHSETAAARARFEPPLRRLAGIVVDVSFDHFLARDFERRAAMPLDAHVERVHYALSLFHDRLPVALQRFNLRMQRESLLVSMAGYHGVQRVLSRLSRRSAVFRPLAEASAVVERLDEPLNDHFERFYPALESYVEYRRSLPDSV